MLGENGSGLSGGQKQRVALARALYGKPRLVVLDEPNSNLDTVGEAALASAIVQMKAQGSSVVLVTHRSSALAQADKLLVLNEGRLQAFGPSQDVLKALVRRAGTATEKTAQAPGGSVSVGSISPREGIRVYEPASAKPAWNTTTSPNAERDARFFRAHGLDADGGRRRQFFPLGQPGAAGSRHSGARHGGGVGQAQGRANHQPRRGQPDSGA